MKILIPLVGTFGRSGGFRVLSHLANYWIKQGHEVCFLSYIVAEDPYFPTDAEILYYDNKGDVSSAKNLYQRRPMFGMFTLRFSLRKAMDKVEADIILANHCFSALPVMQSSNNARKFYYVQAYEPEYYYNKTVKDLIYKRISKNSYKLGLETIVNAEMYRNYKEIKTDKVVFPGLDLGVFKPDVEERHFGEKVVLGTIGRVEAYKGTAYIIKAFKQLRAEWGDKIELHVAFGDHALADVEGIKVIYPENDAELAKYYRSITMYICAGTVQLEAIHYPVIESMGCKIPIITTGYYPASDENAWIIPPKDSAAIRNTVVKVLNSEVIAKVKCESAYLNVKEFSWDAVGDKMLNYFRERD